jgi:hypothetical protein
MQSISLEAGVVYSLTIIYSRKSSGSDSGAIASHYVKVRIPASDPSEYVPFETAFSMFYGYHSFGSPFAPRFFPGPLCAATSSIRGSSLSFRKKQNFLCSFV